MSNDNPAVRAMKGSVLLILGLGALVSACGNGPASAPAANQRESSLLEPSGEGFRQRAPAVFQARFQTTQGDIVLEIHRDWAPLGADRFYNLVVNEFFSDVAFFRVMKKRRLFMAQFGIHGDPEVAMVWSQRKLQDEPVRESNLRGTLSFAKTKVPNTRSTQIFINLNDNSFLDRQGFSPFGKVVEGMDVAESLFGGYGGSAVSQGTLRKQGNAYLRASFPELDYINTANIVGR